MDATKLIEEAGREIAHMKAEALSAANPYNENTIRLTLLIDLAAALKASEERARKAEELAAANLAANKRIVELEHERDAACAELARLTTPRPIEEAPKDGTSMLCWCPGYGWRHLYWDHVWLLVGAPCDEYEPTQFLSLPVKP